MVPESDKRERVFKNHGDVFDEMLLAFIITSKFRQDFVMFVRRPWQLGLHIFGPDMIEFTIFSDPITVPSFSVLMTFIWL